MPWGHPHTFVCIEQGCGKTFESLAINPLRCPEHRQAHNKQRIKARYREKRGSKFGTRPDRNTPLSDMARFNYFMERTWKNAKCPICKQHMSQCRCCEPVVMHVNPAVVETWIPERLPLPLQGMKAEG
jgi:hypothetical protein